MVAETPSSITAETALPTLKELDILGVISQESEVSIGGFSPSSNDDRIGPTVAGLRTPNQKGYKPRRFHLAKIIRDPLRSLPSLNSGVHKSKKCHQRKLPVFQASIEPVCDDARAQALLETLRSYDSLRSESSSTNTTHLRPRKRPNVGAAEQARKMATQNNAEQQIPCQSTGQGPGVKTLLKRLDASSEHLASQLNATVLGELGNQTDKPKDISRSSRLKFRPKPPPSRMQSNQNGDTEAHEI